MELSNDDLVAPFAEAIYAKSRWLAKWDVQLDMKRRARLLESISDDIKKVGNFLPHHVSEAAASWAEDLKVDLSQMTWHDQPSFDAGREWFHVEHMVPVSDIRKVCFEASSVGEIVEILKTKLRVVWILKEEDDRLTQRGYRSKRVNPEQAYKEAGIELRPHL